jgi:methylase of polypeptide subunit release factors
MSLFQKSVEKKYLNELDSALIDKKYAEFQEFFGNAERQENIRNAKEEQFQEGFLRELFVKIFDYTLNPELNYNLTTELKNVSDSKKADGAILRNENAIAVIELKSTDTTDLGKVESQAFGYKNHHPKCVYVITSNFEKLRFYIQNAVNHFEFDLFKLTKEEFSLLWLCLAKDNLLNDLPLKIKESSLAKEENITKQLYADYSKFREALYQNLVKNNPEVDKLTLFKKTQKLIDRFLFIFFAEDKQLLPANSILQIIEKWKDDVDFGDVKSLYSLFRKYFHILNVGRPKSEKRQEIFAYNGGLFLTDEDLENVKIDDDILKEHTLKLSNYDFDTEVDVNILGHIFEHSLGEIENVQAEIKGERVEQEKTKRKKDGIFYTPKYITKYIVNNTIGRLCEEKRKELEIVDEEYAKGRKNRRKETIKVLDAKLTSYREWLKSLTIIDPACGSGAFLNQALEFLIEEHRKIDELKAQLLGGGLIFSDITTEILEKNIYGVDINEESVEIAKLSLWLRTAQKGRKLNTLSNNIKCGNSLIDDPEVAGDKAFSWHNEFPDIFTKGGFDVVIGNPPYVRVQNMDDTSVTFFNNNYKTAFKNYDLYILFTEKITDLINSSGIASFIMPKKFVTTDYGKLLKQFLYENKLLKQFIDFDVLQIFPEATTYTGIFTFDKKDKECFEYIKISDNPLSIENIQPTALPYQSIKNESWLLLSNEEIALFEKISNQGVKLIDISAKLFQGLVTGKDSVFILEKTELGFFSKETTKYYNFNVDNELIKPLLKGSEIGRYNTPISNNFVIFPYTIENDNAKIIPLEIIQQKDNTLYTYLLENEKKLRERENGKFDNDNWYSFSRNQNIAQMPKQKILTQVLAKRSSLTIDKTGSYCFVGGGTAGGYGIILKESYSLDKILPILNSKLLQWYIQQYASPFSGGYYAYSKTTMSEFPIILDNYENLNLKTEILSNLINIFEVKSSDMNSLIKSKFKVDKTSKKINEWYNLSFNSFYLELQKLNIKFNVLAP